MERADAEVDTAFLVMNVVAAPATHIPPIALQPMTPDMESRMEVVYAVPRIKNTADRYQHGIEPRQNGKNASEHC